MNKVPVKTVKRWLRVIARGKGYSAYKAGIKKFLTHWHEKTPAQITALCKQLKNAAVNDPNRSLEIFGRGARDFFQNLEINNIKW
jgi:hypothetical protein